MFCLVFTCGYLSGGPLLTCAAFQDDARFPAAARLRIWRSIALLGGPDCPPTADQTARFMGGLVSFVFGLSDGRSLGLNL